MGLPMNQTSGQKVNRDYGIWPAALTPMQHNLDVDTMALKEHCDWLFARGARGVVLLGTTGEANSLTVDERLGLIRQLHKTNLPPEKLMIGTGSCTVRETVELTRAALDAGVQKVLMLPPFYYKQVTDEGLMRYFSAVISQTRNDRLRIWLYNIPQLSGLSFGKALVESLRAEFGPVVAGMKDSGGDPGHMREMISVDPGFTVLSGTERLLREVMEMGGAGCVSATANYSIFHIAELYGRIREDEEYAGLEGQVLKMRSAFEGLPFVPALKGVLAHVQKQASWLHMRPPHVPLPPETIINVVRRLEAAQDS